MSRKITEQKFNEIKEFLSTPILVKPPIRYVAESFGYSSGTIATINRFSSYKEYKNYQHQRYDEHLKNFLDNEIDYLKSEREKAKKEIRDFNNEWFFEDE